MIGYMVLEDWGLVDALYMTVITLTTVGFGEVQQLSAEGRIFTVLLIAGGVGMLAYSASVIGAFFLDGTFIQLLWRTRLDKVISRMRGHCIICGYGRTGQQVVTILREQKVPFIVIDIDPEKVEKLLDDGVAAIAGNAHSNESLQSAGIENARALIACASNDATNVFVTLSARGLREDLTIVTRSESADAELKLVRAGANHVVTPYLFAGNRLVAAVFQPSALDFFDTHVLGASGYEIQEFEVGDDAPIRDQTISNAKLRADYETTILAIRRKNGEVVANPDPNTPIRAGDAMLGFGPVAKLGLLGRQFDG